MQKKWRINKLFVHRKPSVRQIDHSVTMCYKIEIHLKYFWRSLNLFFKYWKVWAPCPYWAQSLWSRQTLQVATAMQHGECHQRGPCRELWGHHRKLYPDLGIVGLTEESGSLYILPRSLPALLLVSVSCVPMVLCLPKPSCCDVHPTEVITLSSKLILPPLLTGVAQELYSQSLRTGQKTSAKWAHPEI